MEELSYDEEYNDIMEDMRNECSKITAAGLFAAHVQSNCAFVLCAV